jgi:hypothetical protein
MSDSPIYDDTETNNTWKVWNDKDEPLTFFDANTSNNDIEHNSNARSVSSDKTVHFNENPVVESFSPDSSYSTDLADYFYLPPDENGVRIYKCYCSHTFLISTIVLLFVSLIASLYYIFAFM